MIPGRKLLPIAILAVAILTAVPVIAQSSTPPTADRVSPSSGYGTAQNFTFQYSSANGNQYLKVLYVLINSSSNGSGGCRVEYLPASNRLYLFNDAGTGLLGPVTPGVTGTLSNSRCALDAGASSATPSGNAINLTAALGFLGTFAGPQNIYGLAFDIAGNNSGWQLLGSWNTAGMQSTPPTADAVSPASGYGSSQIFTFRYSSVNGIGYLNILYGLVNSSNGSGGCRVEYVPSSNQLYLFDDAGTGLLGPLTPGATGILSNSLCSLDAGASSVTAFGNSINVATALSFSGTFAGPQNIYGLAFDVGGTNSNWQLLGTWNTAGLQSMAPTVDSVSPSSGYGTGQTFTFHYMSANGNQYLKVLYALINTNSSAAGGCRVEYLPANNGLYLFNDAGTGLLGPVTPGATGILSNSRCSLAAGGSVVTRFGNSITVAVALTFKDAFPGSQNVYGLAYDVAARNSSWQLLGTWNTAGLQSAPPTTDGVSPSSGYGTSQKFNFHYTSVNGYGYLNILYGLVSDNANQSGGCQIEYVSQDNQLYLINDTGSALLGPVTPGVAGTLSNSQCSLDIGASAVTKFGNSINVTVVLSFSGTFAGIKNLYGLAFDNLAENSGWQLLGTWNTAGLQNAAPTVDSVRPSTGYGTGQKFTFHYSSLNGVQYLKVVYGLISNSTGSGGCRVEYVPASDQLYLFNDASTGLLGPVTPGVAGILSNSQCTLDAGASSAALFGNSATVAVELSFSGTLAGPQNVYGLAYDVAGRNGGWQLLGTWNTAGLQSTPPTADGVGPSSGYGTSQKFTFRYSSVNGYSYLNVLYGWLNGNSNGPGGCELEYVPDGNQLYLIDDTGKGLLGPAMPGVAGTLSNSQCSLDAGSSSVTQFGNSINVTVVLSFAGIFTGPQNVYGLAVDDAGTTNGWQLIGGWNTAGLQNLAPTADSVSPSSGNGAAQMFTFRYSSANGNQYLKVLYGLINSSSNAAAGCRLEYLPATNRLYLFNDAGTGLLGPVTPGMSGTLTNSQCNLDAGASSAISLANSVTLNVALFFSQIFTGPENVYGLAYDIAGNHTNWQLLGTWNTAGPPNVISLSPSSGVGLRQTFTAVYSAYSVSELASVEILIGPDSFARFEPCSAVYVPSTNSLYIYADDGSTLLGPAVPGSTATLSNSQCQLDAASSGIVVAGTVLTVSVSLTFASTYQGTPKMWLLATRIDGQSTGYVPFGYWTPNPAHPSFPQVAPSTPGVTVTPTNQVTTPADISATNDAAVWVADIDGCDIPLCFSALQDPSMGPTIVANWTSSKLVQQADISTGSAHPLSKGEWDLSQKSSLIHYIKDENASFADPLTNTSLLDHYVLLYDKNLCFRVWFVAGTEIPVGKWVQISVADIKAGRYFYQSCPLDYSHITYFEVGVFGPNLPFATSVSLQVASVGSQ